MEVLGFPCNQFGSQEPDDAHAIEAFVRSGVHEGLSGRKAKKYEHPGATFDLFEKVEVNGPGTHPVFKFLKEQTGVAKVRGNFNKWLVDRHGNVRYHFEKKVAPADMNEAITELLNE